MHDLRSTLLDLFAAFAESHARVVLVGGIAVSLHGMVRATSDIDLVADLRPLAARQTTDVLTRVGFRPLPPVDPAGFADPSQRREWIESRNLRVLSFARDGQPPFVDLFVEEPIAFDELWADAEMVRLGGVPLRVVSLDHLIRMKRDSGRLRDLADVEDLLAIRAANRGGMVREGGWDAPREDYRAACALLSTDERLAMLMGLAGVTADRPEAALRSSQRR